MKSTKKSLVASLIVLCLCFASLIGTTFAWFTDEVNSTGNVIKTGTLDVEMYWAEGTEDPANATWKDASAGAIFTNDKWEPGYTVARHLKIENKGTLAFNYKLAIIPHGEVSKLADVIEVYYSTGGKGATQVDSRDDRDGLTNIGTLRELINNGIAEGMLEEKGIYDATIVLKMQQTAGNEYMNLSIGSDFSIQLLATQVPSESDSFDKNYDANAFTTVKDVGGLRTAINSAVDTTTIFLQAGTYNVDSVITMSDKEITIVGLGVVNFVKVPNSTHIMNIADDSEVTIKNINFDGNGLKREGVYVRNNTTVNLVNCYIKNTGGFDIMIDEASDAEHGLETTSIVNLVNSHVEDVAMCASPVTTVAATQDTYARFNFDAESSVGSIEKQGINKKPENCYVNGDNGAINGTVFYAANDADLAKVLETINTNSKYWNTATPVVVKLAAGEYSDDYVINQYPKWDGAGNLNSSNGVADTTNIKLVGASATTYSLRAAATPPAVVFTGKVTVNGWGNAGNGFEYATGAATVFENVAFDGSNIAPNSDGDIIGVTLTAAAYNVDFNGCAFANTTHVVLGYRAANRVADIAFNNCTFENAGCLSGYPISVALTDCVATDAKGGFLNVQNQGTVTVDGCEIDCDTFFLRTNGSGVKVNVTNSEINVSESAGEKHLVWFRGSDESLTFKHCDISADYTLKGVDNDSNLTIVYEKDGFDVAIDGVSDEMVFQKIPADFAGDTVVVPEGVTSFVGSAFANNNVKTVILPSTVRDLGRAFDSTNVEKVVLNEGLTTISSRAFKATANLKEVVIPSTVTTLADDAFQKTGLKTIVIPASVDYIGVQAFGASKIETVIIEGNVTINNKAFRGCPNLRTMTINGDDINFINVNSGSGDCWICNSESNNPNTTTITFNVKNPIVAKKVKAAMGVDTGKVTINCETEVDEETGYYIDAEGNKCVFALNTAELISAIKEAPVFDDGKALVIYLGNTTYSGDIKITLEDLGKQGGDVVIKAMDGAKPVISGTVTLGYRNQGVGAAMYNANVTFDGITFDHASAASHSIDVQDVKSLHLINCTIIGDGEYGLTSARGNATGTSEIVGCTFENAGMQLLGNYATGLVIDGCTFTESVINVQAGNGVTVKNCTFTNTVTDANNNESFYVIRTNSTPVTVEDCEFNVNSTVTGVGIPSAKGWGVFVNRGSTNWTVSDVNIAMTDAALAQPALKVAACTSTGKINLTNVTLNGATYVRNAAELKNAVAAGATNLYLAPGEYNVDGCGGKTLTINGTRATVLKVMNEGEDGCDYGFGAGGTGVGNITFNGVTIDTTSNSGNYKGYAYMFGTYNDCAFVGGYALHRDSYFYNCEFNFKNNYVWTWGASKVVFDGCTFDDENGIAKAILVHCTTSTEITVKDCVFNGTTGAKTWDKIPVAAVSIDPNGAHNVTVKFEGNNVVSEAYNGAYQVKYANEAHLITVFVDGIEVSVPVGENDIVA